MKPYIFFSVILLAMISCNEETFDFDNVVIEYQKVKDCLNQNKDLFFSGDSLNSKSIYSEDLQRSGICSEYLTKDFKKKFSFIVIYKSGNTTQFYSEGNSGLKKIQFILVYTEDESDLDNIPGDAKMIGNYGRHWFRFERVLSLAN